MPTATRVIKNTGYLYAKMGVTMFISLYITRLILNSLGSSDFGIFGVVGGAISMLGFLNAAMTSATQRFMSYAEGAGETNNKKTIFNISVILHLLIALCVGIILEVAYCFFFNGILNIPEDRVFAAKCIYHFMVISTMFTITTVPYDAVINAHENMRYYSIVGVFESLLKLGVALIVVYTLSDKLIVYGLLMASVSIIIMAIKRIYCHHHYDECIFAPCRYFDKKKMKEMTSFAGWNLFQTSVAMISNNGIAIVLNMFFGTIVNAAQSLANQICNQLLIVTSTISKVVSPIIVKSEGSQNRERMLRLSTMFSKISFLSISFFAVVIFIEIPYILKLWLVDVPDYAAFFIRCHIIISLCENLMNGFTLAISAVGKIKGISIIKSIIKIGYLPISYVMFKLGYTPYYTYIILILMQGVLNGIVVPLYFMKKELHYDINKYMRNVLYPCFAVIIFSTVGCLLFQTMETSILKLCIECIMSTLFFIVALFLFALTKEEKTIVYSIVSNAYKYIKR